MPTVADYLTDMRRETDRGRIAARLKDVADMAVDVTTGHAALTWADVADETGAQARLQVPGQQFIFPDGVYDWLDLHVTRSARAQMADRLKVPRQYVDRLLPDHVDLFAHNFNTLAGREDRPATLRLLRADDGYLLRGIVSDRYAAIDNLDVLNAVIGGLTAADVGLGECEVDADWSIDKFRLRIAVPQIAVAVPELTDGYRPMFSMLPGRDVHARPAEGETSPMLWAGLEVFNGESGAAALRIVPRAVFQVCRNGLTRTSDIVRQVHVGDRLDAGVRWSADTRRLSMELLTSKVSDAVSTFLTPGYLQSLADEMRAAKDAPVVSPSHAMEVLGRARILGPDEADRVLDLFATSGDPTVFGLGQAVTAAAQHAETGDRQSEMEDAVWQVFALRDSLVTA